MSLNKILIIGNLGNDPEIRYTQTGKPVASFRIATNRKYKVEGVLKEETEWFRVIAFGRLAEICSEFLKKGKQVFIEGRVHNNQWVDAQGSKHYQTDVIAEGLTMIGRPNGNSRLAPSESTEGDEKDPF